jgi:hypothetical protein
MFITRVRLFVCNETADYQLFIAKGNNASTVLCNLPLPGLQIDQWDTVSLATPIQIDVNQELWIGYKIINQPAGDYAGGVDNGPAVIGLGDMISVNGTDFVSVYSLNPALNYNWNIEALLSNRIGDRSLDNNEVLTGLQLLGYNLYRNNVRLNSTTITDTTWLDAGLPGNTYNYYVKALYNEGESVASNTASVSIPVSFEIINVVQDIKLYPQPASDFVVLESKSIISGFQILEISGKEIYNYKMPFDKLKINTQAFKPGIYMLILSTEKGPVTTRITIQ